MRGADRVRRAAVGGALAFLGGSTVGGLLHWFPGLWALPVMAVLATVVLVAWRRTRPT